MLLGKTGLYELGKLNAGTELWVCRATEHPYWELQAGCEMMQEGSCECRHVRVYVGSIYSFKLLDSNGF